MNLPNRLTVTRLVLAPVFFVVFFLPELIAGFNPLAYAIILVLLYGVMELTDLLDGKIARGRGLVTDLGKVLDPFSDVICHLSFFTCLLTVGIMPVWTFILILWREFTQSFTRMLMMGRGKAMAANIFGKSKTVLYAFSCICGFAFRICFLMGADQGFISVFGTVLHVLFGLAAFASVMSYVIYARDIARSGVLKDMTR